ncbi:hypothetical protein MAPG_00790 [Magnaporthiopsis poae ATCC 64411]|uniref:Protamine P1 n=1 Tax=Magnaporthiopsis poae (strain ATCC 64411 / 73-15) TaxID=644358 RepID=A0A0C4DLY9_MAGP6|nr:hypothetical protein MAPG_00790 [Magnaporthiopsis poae ATCC 64411]
MAEDGRQVRDGPDDSAIFETYHRADDVLYIGSDDEHYESPSHRLQRCRDHYNAFNEKGWRVPPVLLTAKLKGPFSSDVWENPWRSRSAVPTKIGRRSKTAATARVTKPLQDSAPTMAKAHPILEAGSILGLVPDTATNIIKPKTASKPAARRLVAPARESTSGLSSAGSVFAVGGEPASRRNPRKRGGSSTDWLRRVSSPKRPRSGSREEPFASSPTDKLFPKRSAALLNESSSAAGSGSKQAPAQAQPLQPLQGAPELYIFPDEDAFIEDSFVIDEDSMAHTPVHPSRFQPENPTLMDSGLLAPHQETTTMPAIRERFLAAFNESHSASTADTGSVANDSVVRGNKDTAQASVPGVPRLDTRFETQQDESFCYQAKARLPDAWTASGIPHYNTEIRDEELQREQVSVPSLTTTDQPNMGQSTQDPTADESSWAGFESDSESPAITNAAPSPLADVETTTATCVGGSVEAHPDEDAVPALFSTVKAKTAALSPAEAPTSERAIKTTSATGDETLVPEHGCTTTFDSEEPTLLAEADTAHAPPFFFQLKEASADPGTEEPVTSVTGWSRRPASSRSALTPTPPQAVDETTVRLPQFSLQHSHQIPSESLILLPQSSAEMEAIQARFAVSGLPEPETHEVAIEGLDKPTLPPLVRGHVSAVGAPNEDDVWDGKVEHDDSHPLSYPPDTGGHLSSDTSYAGARLATQDQSPWAAPHTVQLHAPLPSSPMIKPLAEPAPANLPPMHPLYAPMPTMQSPWAHVDLQVPCVPVNGAVSPLSLSFDLRDDEVPNPVLPSFDNIQKDKYNTLPQNGRPSTPEDKLSSLPTPDLSVSNKPFRRFLSPSPRSKRRYGDFGNAEIITVDGLPRETPVIGDMIPNPWLQHQRPAKRVRFAPLPGEKVEDQQDSTTTGSPSCSAPSDPPSSSGAEGDGDEDYIEAGLPKQKSQSVARAKKVAALATAGSAPSQPAPARPCSPPPPSRTSAEDLPSEVTLFRKHFAKMQGKQLCLTPRPTFTRLFTDKGHASPSSQAADAAAERFIDADRRRDDISNAVLGGGSGVSGGILKLQSALKTSAVPHDDGIDDVSAVINNLGDFLGSWDLDSELAKATAEKERDRDAESRLNPFSIPMDVGQWS